MAIKSISVTIPLIYCYTTPGVPYHDGWVKIGYTEQILDKRIKQQANTIGIRKQIEWQEFAVYTDGSGLVFTDEDFKAYLISKGVNNINQFGDNGESIGDEWYEMTPTKAKEYFDDFRRSPSAARVLREYHLRDEQKKAVINTKNIIGSKSEVLWNAKPRFGKCLSCYDFCKEIGAKNVLIVTNRPAVANSWYSDYVKFLGRESGYFFVSHVSEIAKEDFVFDYPVYENDRITREKNNSTPMGMIYFVSLQDIKGSEYFGNGGGWPKLKELTIINWDVLVVDESHEGVETYKTNTAFNYIKRKFTLYLSGTPFRAIKDEKFDDEAIYNWTYVDEQEKNERWNGEGDNPYQIMPRLNLITYRLSNIIGGQSVNFSGEENDEVSDGMNELFKYVNGRFIHEEEVDVFLDKISSISKYPFGSEESRNELKHTFWLLQSFGDNEAANVKALAIKLRNHPVFGQYEIVIAADNGKANDEDQIELSSSHYKRVMNAIKNCDSGASGKRGTITLSVKSLTTGVTVPQWTGVLMLSERNSAAEYMQASFRSQNPYIFSKTNHMTGETKFYRKTNAYVFDFNPAHTLNIIEEFANNLYSSTVNGKGEYSERKLNIEKLLHYMPVTGEDEDGLMKPYEAEAVMLIPRKMHSEEVVRKGFMCDRLFQNISNVFRVSDIGRSIVYGKLPVCTDSGTTKTQPGSLAITQEEIEQMHLDDEGEVNVPDDYIKAEVKKTITEKEKERVQEKVISDIKRLTISTEEDKKERDKERESFINAYTQAVVQNVTDDIKSKNPTVVTKSVETAIKRDVAKKAREKANILYSDYVHDKKIREDEIRETLKDCTSEKDRIVVEQMVKESNEEVASKFKETAIASVANHVQESYEIADRTKEYAKANNLKADKLDEYKKRLKSFTRTIPSFLMAYGDDNIRLENMDSYVDPVVFQEVAYITVEEFRILRDECEYFNTVVCNDAMQTFLRIRKQLTDYFDDGCFVVMEGQKFNDIFDLIPPQKTNQIYTPKSVVKTMCDYLGKVNPGCFDNPESTFIDPYMKSGLYITEIVKRLFHSKKLKELFPNDNARLQHIFNKQVYGLAPTTIIYKIATNYILGFAENRDIEINTGHFVELDALPYVQGVSSDKLSLKEKLAELFGM